jgi:hypothetical protein
MNSTSRTCHRSPRSSGPRMPRGGSSNRRPVQRTRRSRHAAAPDDGARIGGDSIGHTTGVGIPVGSPSGRARVGCVRNIRRWGAGRGIYRVWAGLGDSHRLPADACVRPARGLQVDEARGTLASRAPGHRSRRARSRRRSPHCRTRCAGRRGHLLQGPEGSALVLANYTYQPIPTLRVRLTMTRPVTDAVSTEGVRVKRTPAEDGTGGFVELPLEWTDIVLLR